jgi:anthranilate synthase component II
MILIIDNYDSFTYNLYQMIGEVVFSSNEEVAIDRKLREKLSQIKVIRNDEMDLSQIRNLQPQRIIISPGPGNPVNKRDFGVCRSVIEKLGDTIPILGVCLGHQGIFSTFGGKIIHEEPVHGKQSELTHEGNGIFQGLDNPLLAARYHSLICDPENVPESIEITAQTHDGIIMALKHKRYPIFGLQFHPESIGTEEGKKIVKNFLEVEP